MSKRSVAVDDRKAGNVVEMKARPVPEVREAHDSGHHQILKHDPSDEDARLDIALDESFPTSDAPSHARPGSGGPAASSGYDEKAEALILQLRKRKAALRSAARVGLPILLVGGLIIGAALWLTPSWDED